MEQSEKRQADLESDTNIFAPYYKKLAPRTRKRQWTELASVRAFALERGLLIGNLATDALSWSKVKEDLIFDYVTHLKEQHYTASSIAIRLHTIKTYARLAMENDHLQMDEYKRIASIQAPSDTEGESRRGEKRGKYLDLTDEQVQQLLNQPDTPQGRRDTLLLALLLLCGLWPREIAALNRHSIDTKRETITFYDYHAEEQQVLHLDATTLAAAARYLQEPSPHEALFVGNQKESLHTLRMTDRAINARIRTLGKKIGTEILAPQDCHAYWAKSQSKKKPQTQSQPTSQAAANEVHPSVTERPLSRKQRPDIFNRRAFEEAMLRKGVDESMLAPSVSDSRLILPWMVEFISQQETQQQEFLQYIQKQLPQYGLKENNLSFYEEILGHLAAWMDYELEKYRRSRS